MPIRSSVTVSLVTEARGGPFVFWDDLTAACRTAKTLGFDAIEVFPPSAAALDVGLLRKLLSDHGLTLAAVGTGGGWVRERLHLCLPDPKARRNAREFIRAIVETAASLGAPAVIGSMQGKSSEEVDRATALNYLGEALEDLGECAAGLGTRLVYEPLNRYETNLASTLADASRLLAALSTKNVVLLADLFHMNIEEQDPASAIRAAARLIGHVHFVDSNRRPAGFGHTDFAPIAAALGDIGYDGFVSAEAFPYPDPEAAARATIDAYREFFRTNT
jgi:sugar phosphate isomerase/epimerase